MVRSSSPSVLMSSRPTATTRGRSSGSASNTVARPSGSRAVVTSPRGLWNSQSRVRSRAGSGSPSTVMRSESVTLTAGESSTWPFRVTRPARIIVSASRREAMPARAIALAMRSPSKTVSASGAVSGAASVAGPAAASGSASGALRRLRGASPSAERLRAAFGLRSGRSRPCAGSGRSLLASVEGTQGSGPAPSSSLDLSLMRQPITERIAGRETLFSGSMLRRARFPPNRSPLLRRAL
ncbi:hypothetical protein MTDSW087_05719 [Methylobacterium dankookense]|uniref:Uncharacterized protein n=1 Tax=Methylobacterium dankookense TaxID=560405 RepID=A0A564G837_9HYPH|nr:hypothetical protein MTDSW087_05719 [Methylobacterium dankookense]